MADQKIVLLDVDDVILMSRFNHWELARAAEAGEEPEESGFVPPGARRVPGYISAAGVEQRAWVDPWVLARLRSLAPEVEIRWLTSWLALEPRHLQRLQSELGLGRVVTPDLGDIEPGRYGMNGSSEDRYHWKARMVRATLLASPGTPVLWVDDQLEYGLVRQMERKNLSIIAPDGGRGLTRSQVQRIHRWAAAPEEFTLLHGDRETGGGPRQ